jgi:CrcB protein
MIPYLYVMAGAAAGGLARYVVGSFIQKSAHLRFPIGTFVVNVTGCFLIGLVMTWFSDRHDPNPNLRLLLVTGVLGGYTTFSSFAWESFVAVEERALWTGVLNLVGSVVAGYIAVVLGAWLARR